MSDSDAGCDVKPVYLCAVGNYSLWDQGPEGSSVRDR